MLKSFVTVLIAILAFVLTPLQAQAADTVTVLGHEVTPIDMHYLVKKDVNVRDKPDTKAKKVGKFDSGDVIKGVGRVNDQWIAAELDDVRGFVYTPVLTPYIKGELTDPLRGKTKGPGGEQCEYIVNFEGESESDAENMRAADYEVGWRCLINGKPQIIQGFMFMTETPYDLGNKPVFQISVDMVRVTEAPDSVMSTIFIYNYDKQTVTFDGLTMIDYTQEPKIKEYRAKSVEEALRVAVETAPVTWKPKTWQILLKRNF